MDEISISSSGPRVLTPRSSTLSSSPLPDPLQPPPAGTTTGLLTLESARDSIAWLAGQMVYAIERVSQARAAGYRPRADDVWVINQASTLLARLTPHMEDRSGAFTLDGRRLMVPTPPPPLMPRPAGGADDTDGSAAARRRMEEFSSGAVRQLELAMREQRQRLRSFRDHFEDEIMSSLVPRKRQQQQPPSPSPQQNWHRPLVVNGSSPFQTKTETEASASTGGTQAPEQQHHPQEQQQQQPRDDASGQLPTEHRQKPAAPAPTTTPPATTASGVASAASRPASPPNSSTHASGVQPRINNPFPQCLPSIGAAMSSWPTFGPSWGSTQLRSQHQSTQIDVPATEYPLGVSSSWGYHPRSPNPQLLEGEFPEPGHQHLVTLHGPRHFLYGQNDAGVAGEYRSSFSSDPFDPYSAYGQNGARAAGVSYNYDSEMLASSASDRANPSIHLEPRWRRRHP